MYGMYAEAMAILGKRDRKKVANNTYLERRENGAVAYKLHATDVVTIRPDDSAILATGGWYTPTTKDRINRFGPLNVYSERGVWRLYRWNPDAQKLEKVGRFFDGIEVSPEGTIVNPLPDDAVKLADAEAKETRQAIRAYVKLAMAKLSEGLPLPSGGDCWGCYFVTDDGGDPMGTDHLREHFREGYVVPSLLWNAVREKGYPYPAIILGASLEGMGGTVAHIDLVKRSLTRYLEKRLLKGRAIR